MDLAEICNGLSPENYDAAVEVAKIPEKLRGYGHIKARNRKTLLCRRSQLLDEFRGNIQFVEINEKKAA
jgi:indolepyruvate ferredoxin oxidoreductase